MVDNHDDAYGSLLMETRKLEARFAEFLECEKIFVKELQRLLEKLNALYEGLNKMDKPITPDNRSEIEKLKLQVIDSLNEVMKKASKADHEKSHLLESYGALISSIEHNFQELFSRIKS
ncbi:MAG: hypothetical protein QXU99_02285 [Candidatus Bathyarchaeia archaeon]